MTPFLPPVFDSPRKSHSSLLIMQREGRKGSGVYSVLEETASAAD